MQPKTSVFVSYNSADAEYCRRLAAALAATGAKVWFDEWTVRPGDSIPAAVEVGLAGFDIFALVWSKAASSSRWVRTEMDTALNRWLKGDSCRLVPIRLDDTPIPSLLGSILHIDGTDHNHIRVARALLGIESDTVFRLAVQEFITEAAGLEFREFPGVGVLVSCPRCGATLDKIRGWEQIDRSRDDLYVGAQCIACGWSDGSEV